MPGARPVVASRMPTPTDRTTRDWADRLRLVASRADGVGTLWDTDATPEARRAFAADFRDELGNRARVITPFLSAVLGVDPGPHPTAKPDLDDRLWWAVHDPDAPIGELIGDQLGEQLGNLGHPFGPLDPALNEIGIEARTEIELSSMHALLRLGLDRSDPSLVERCLDAARWHIGAMQPDNGTNHPWGIHVFVLLAGRSGDPGEAAAAMMHAQTLLHNCQVQQGRPDRLSACILWDAALTLAAAAGSMMA